MKLYHLSSILITIIFGSTAGCQAGTGTSTQPVETPSPVISAPTPSPTAASPEALLFIDLLDHWELVSDQIVRELEEIANEQGWLLQRYSEIPDPDPGNRPALVLIAGGGADLSPYLNELDDTFVILVGTPGAEPAEGVAVIGPEGMRPDKVAFISGFIAAMTTADWRVGALGGDGTGEGRAAMKGFDRGAIYFCGLCRPAYPPFHAYPSSVTVPTLDEAAISSSYAALNEKSVKTIGLTHEISDDLVDYAVRELGSNDTYWLGPAPPAESNRGQWVVTVLPDPSRDIRETYEKLLRGEAAIRLPMGYTLEDVNVEILTEGKMDLIGQVMRDLEAGIIDTGVDPLSGEDR